MYLCAQRSTPRISLGQIPKGYAGTKKTVAYIIGLIRACRVTEVGSLDERFQPKEHQVLVLG